MNSTSCFVTMRPAVQTVTNSKHAAMMEQQQQQQAAAAHWITLKHSEWTGDEHKARTVVMHSMSQRDLNLKSFYAAMRSALKVKAPRKRSIAHKTAGGELIAISSNKDLERAVTTAIAENGGTLDLVIGPIDAQQQQKKVVGCTAANVINNRRALKQSDCLRVVSQKRVGQSDKQHKQQRNIPFTAVPLTADGFIAPTPQVTTEVVHVGGTQGEGYIQERRYTVFPGGQRAVAITNRKMEDCGAAVDRRFHNNGNAFGRRQRQKGRGNRGRCNNQNKGLDALEKQYGAEASTVSTSFPDIRRQRILRMLAKHSGDTRAVLAVLVRQHAKRQRKGEEEAQRRGWGQQAQEVQQTFPGIKVGRIVGLLRRCDGNMEKVRHILEKQQHKADRRRGRGRARVVVTVQRADTRSSGSSSDSDSSFEEELPQPQGACYICGMRGHVARDCPSGRDSSSSSSSEVYTSESVDNSNSADDSEEAVIAVKQLFPDLSWKKAERIVARCDGNAEEAIERITQRRQNGGRKGRRGGRCRYRR